MRRRSRDLLRRCLSADIGSSARPKLYQRTTPRRRLAAGPTSSQPIPMPLTADEVGYDSIASVTTEHPGAPLGGITRRRYQLIGATALILSLFFVALLVSGCSSSPIIPQGGLARRGHRMERRSHSHVSPAMTAGSSWSLP